MAVSFQSRLKKKKKEKEKRGKKTFSELLIIVHFSNWKIIISWLKQIPLYFPIGNNFENL